MSPLLIFKRIRLRVKPKIFKFKGKIQRNMSANLERMSAVEAVVTEERDQLVERL